MNQKSKLRPWLAALLAAGVIIPIAICVVLGIGTLLTAMGDTSGGHVLNRISLAFAILWVIDLILLIFVHGAVFLLNDHQKTDNPDE